MVLSANCPDGLSSDFYLTCVCCISVSLSLVKQSSTRPYRFIRDSLMLKRPSLLISPASSQVKMLRTCFWCYSLLILSCCWRWLVNVVKDMQSESNKSPRYIFALFTMIDATEHCYLLIRWRSTSAEVHCELDTFSPVSPTVIWLFEFRLTKAFCCVRAYLHSSCRRSSRQMLALRMHRHAMIAITCPLSINTCLIMIVRCCHSSGFLVGLCLLKNFDKKSWKWKLRIVGFGTFGVLISFAIIFNAAYTDYYPRTDWRPCCPSPPSAPWHVCFTRWRVELPARGRHHPPHPSTKATVACLASCIRLLFHCVDATNSSVRMFLLRRNGMTYFTTLFVGHSRLVAAETTVYLPLWYGGIEQLPIAPCTHSHSKKSKSLRSAVVRGRHWTGVALRRLRSIDPWSCSARWRDCGE